MLGRFLCQSHPVAFWKEFDSEEIVFLLNEYILFEKYMQVLTEFGERHLSRTKNKILTEDLEKIPLSFMDPTLFVTLKMHLNDWVIIEGNIRADHDPEIRQLLTILQRPYGYFFDYDTPWSFKKLKEICDQEKLPIPDKNAV